MKENVVGRNNGVICDVICGRTNKKGVVLYPTPCFIRGADFLLGVGRGHLVHHYLPSVLLFFAQT